MGLYMVLWGKSKDYLPSEPLIKNKLSPADEELNLKTLNQDSQAAGAEGSGVIIREVDESV